MLRPTNPNDTLALLQLARGTDVFYPHEIDILAEVIQDYFQGEDEAGQVMQTWDVAGIPCGFVHFCPVPMTIGTWELWWIVVSKDHQGQGLGRRILKTVEAMIQERGGRNLFIETSSTPPYEATRQFYLRCGYSEVARLPGYYREGDDKVVYHRVLGGTGSV